jgi:crotonobetainyl-CoA:carnitine CoA-transferase CaiB-like acyl-CoA transferase
LGRYLVEGIDELRVGNSSLVAQPLGAYEASDGRFLLTIAGDALFVKFCRNALDRPDLAEDARFSGNAARVTNRLALKDELEAIFASGTVDYWLERLRAAGIPAGAIRSTGEALDSYETEARGLVLQASHTSEGTVPVVRSPLHFSDTPVRAPVGAPLLGEHSSQVLRDIGGLSDGQIEELLAKGILKGC